MTFHAEDFLQMMLQGWIDQLKLIVIETISKNNQHYAMWETDDILKISKSIKLLVKMKNVFYFMEKTGWTFWPSQTCRTCALSGCGCSVLRPSQQRVGPPPAPRQHLFCLSDNSTERQELGSHCGFDLRLTLSN